MGINLFIHRNNGDCEKCDSIFAKYGGFHRGLRDWFKYVQSMHIDAHIYEAGRGRMTQESYKKTGRSRAGWGESAHNFNAAIDIFRQIGHSADFSKKWFNEVVGKNIEDHNRHSDFKLKWYGEKGSSFFELPHVEVSDWKLLNLRLVE